MKTKLIFLFIFFCTISFAKESPKELAEQTQNIFSNLLRFSFQYDTIFPVGDYDKAQKAFQFRALVPTNFDNWLLVSRLVVPYTWKPQYSQSEPAQSGLLNSEMDFLFSPKSKNNTFWGIGPSIWLPTSSNEKIVAQTWALGPMFGISKTWDSWVLSIVVKQLWSLSSEDISTFAFDYTIGYNFENGTYLTTSPSVSCDWEIQSGHQCMIPFGMGVGKVVWLKRIPIDFNLQGYYNVTTTIPNARWDIVLNLLLLFPK